MIDQVAREVLFEADTVTYTVDGDTYSVKGELRLQLGPRLRFVRLAGQLGSDGLPPPERPPSLPPPRTVGDVVP